MLANSPHFDGTTMSATWAEHPDATVVEKHQIVNHWQKMKEE